jgi:hypothetical protein
MLCRPVVSQGVEEGSAQVPRPANAAEATCAWMLIARCQENRHNVMGLAESVTDLSEEQRTRLRALSGSYQREKERLLEQLREEYSQKTRAALSEPQRQRFDGVLKALDALAKGANAAREELLKETGTDDGRFAHLSPYHLPLTDTTAFLDLSERKRARLMRLRTRMNRSLAAAARGLADPDAPRNSEQRQDHRDKYERERKRAEAEFEAQRRKALSPEELEQLEKAEAALARYRERLQEIQRQAYSEIASVLQPDAEG